VRSILDGHIILSRELGAAGHYPAIDVLNSVSRLAPRLAAAGQNDAAVKIREALATYRRAEDLINLGAYTAGANAMLDSAIRVRPQLLKFLKQDSTAAVEFPQTLQQMQQLAAALA